MYVKIVLYVHSISNFNAQDKAVRITKSIISDSVSNISIGLVFCCLYISYCGLNTSGLQLMQSSAWWGRAISAVGSSTDQVCSQQLLCCCLSFRQFRHKSTRSNSVSTTTSSSSSSKCKKTCKGSYHNRICKGSGSRNRQWQESVPLTELWDVRVTCQACKGWQ